MLTILLVPVLATAPAGTRQVSSRAADSQPKPNDIDLHDSAFGNAVNQASLKLRHLTLGKPRRDASGAITTQPPLRWTQRWNGSRDRGFR